MWLIDKTIIVKVSDDTGNACIGDTMTKKRKVICPKCNKEKEGIFSTFIDDIGRKGEYCECQPELKLEVEPKSIRSTILFALVLIVIFGGLMGLSHIGKHYTMLKVITGPEIVRVLQYDNWDACTDRCMDKWQAENNACWKIDNLSDADKCLAKADYNLTLCQDDCNPLFPK